MEKIAQPLTLAEAFALLKAHGEALSEASDKKLADERDASDRKFASALEASDKRFESALEGISNLRVELKQEINEIKKDCDTKISKADEAVQKIEKLEGVVKTFQVDLEEKIQSTVESQVQDLGHRIESRLGKLEREDNTLTILGSDMTVAQGNIESLKKGRGLEAQDQHWLKEITGLQEEMQADIEKLKWR